MGAYVDAEVIRTCLPWTFVGYCGVLFRDLRGSRGEHLCGKLPEVFSRLFQRTLPCQGYLIVPSPTALNCLVRALQIARRLHLMEDGVEGAWAHGIAVPSQLLDQPCAVNGSLGCVVEDVQPDKASEQLA